MYYSDALFAYAVGEKLGNVKYVKYVKRIMREAGKIKPYQQLQSFHKPYFREIQQLHVRNRRMTWDKAIRTVVPKMPAPKRGVEK